MALKASQNVIISGHITPDGDSIGSTIALGLALKKAGKKVTMASPDPLPDNYLFLPGADLVVHGLPAQQYDTFIVVDCSVPDRLGKHLVSLLNDGVTVVNIDHHASESTFGDLSYIDSQAAATGEIIYDLLVEMGTVIDKEMAINLYTAIVTDTGSFRYEGTSAETHRRVASLLECGVPVARLSKLIFDEKPLEVIKVLKEALPTLTVSQCGKVAWISFDWTSKEKTGAKDEHTDNLISYPRQIKGVEVALLFREQAPNMIKVGMRSNYYVDVNQLAGLFGGGGHKRASGCQMAGNIEEVKEKVITAALAAVKRGQ
ncbi:bifunctional oligoribonuclease/PAP phosphatase NrnA [Peptococcaceae bacterium 1198_IL3148]